MIVNIAIVDDDESGSGALKKFVEKYAETSEDIFNVTQFSDGDEIASDYTARYDVILMDIHMKRMDGLAAAKLIRKLDKDVIIIFITSLAQYAINGYSVDALDFLLKPVSYFAFSQQIKRSVERLKARGTDHILLRTENGVMKIDTASVVYIESVKHKMYVYTGGEVYAHASTMRELERQFGGKNFFRCNSGYLINLAYVKGIKDNIVKIGKYELVISRARRKAFMDALAAYVGGRK